MVPLHQTRPSPWGPDGVARPADEETRLNQLAATVFRGADGEALLDYLRSITITAVCGPEISANALFHREGMRFLVGIIEQRIKLGRTNDRTNADAQPSRNPRPRASRTARAGTVARPGE